MRTDAYADTVAEEAQVGARPGSRPAEATFSDTDEPADGALLAQRLAWFGYGSAALSGGFLAYRLVNNAITDHEGVGVHTRSIDLAHAGSVAFYLAMALCAGSSRLRGQLRVVESIGLVGASSCLIAMSGFITLWVQPRFIALLALAVSMFLRVAFVPSTARFTALLGAVLAVPLAVVTYRTGLTFDPAVYGPLEPSLAQKTSSSFAIGVTIDALAWWAMIVIACSAASRVIFGLRNEVRAVRKLGRYHLEERLGAGGMGVVYRARHALVDRPVAIKVLPAERLTADGRRRFQREVELTARLRHPSTISVFDYGRAADGTFYYAMEYIPGATLAEVVAVSGPQPPSRIVAILRAVAGALIEAHGLGLVHRDLKPANVMVHLPHRHGGVEEVVKVLDFGLVKNTREDGDVAHTRPGTVRGTPQYLSPESIKDPDAVGPRSDLYALGAVGYFLRTGEPVFAGDSVVEVCAQHLRDEPIEPSLRASIEPAPALDALILALLRKRPDERPSSASSLDMELAELSIARWSVDDATRWWAGQEDALAQRRDAARASVSEDLDPLLSSRKLS